MTNTIRRLNSEQIEKVRIYFKTLAKLRGEEYLNSDDDFLSILVHTWCMIELDGGGDPVKLAKRLV